VLRASHLSVTYRNRKGVDVPAVCDATFQILRGEIVGIFGSSGAGKTSLGLALLNLLPPSAIRRAATIEFEGVNLVGLTERQMRSIRGKRIAIMHQEPALSLNPVIRVGDQISEVIRAHEARTWRQRRVRVLSLLRSVDLPEEMYDSYPHELSGGERHRIVIAQALTWRPALIIADEPTAGLDPELKTELLKLVLHLRNEAGVAFIVISHDQKMLAQIADRTLGMTSGRLTECHPESRATEPSLSLNLSSPMRGSEAINRSEPLISVRALSKSFGRQTGWFRNRFSSADALQDVSFFIEPGSSFGLTGPSGSGKSTLAKCIAGWEQPDSGQILFRGEDLIPRSDKVLDRSRIQLILQDSAAAFNPNFTAEEIVEEPLLVQRTIDKHERRARVQRLFLETGLAEDMLRRGPLTFSGGQRQRLAIARALILNPELVIFDESMTGLDSETREQILTLLTRLKTARNLTYLLISHDADLLSRAADTVATMRNGRIVGFRYSEAPKQLSHHVEHRKEVAAEKRVLAAGESA